MSKSSNKRPIPKLKSLLVENESCGKSNRRSEKLDSSLLSNGSSDEIDPFDLVRYNDSPPTRPCGRDSKNGWYEMHEKHVELASRTKATVLLCGDSIIAGLSRYSNVWNKHFKPWNAINCGIGGDQTQHVLWRMENMTLPFSVKYIILHCGTNNIDRDLPQEIANGVISCGLVLQDNNPELKIIVTGLLPRDYENTSRRYKISETNTFLKNYCQQLSNFTFMKQGDDWVLDDGFLNEVLYYSDHLHLIESGNHKLARSIIDILEKISNNEEIVYSDNEDNIEIKSSKFERRLGKRRSINDIYDSPYKFVRPDVVTNKRKRTLSPVTPIEIKRRKTDSPVYCSKRITQINSSPDVNSTYRKKIIIPDSRKEVKTEFHGQFNLSKECKYDKLHLKLTGNEIPLAGTAKSIDISLTDTDRRAARMAKFSGASKSAKFADNRLIELSEQSKTAVRSLDERK